VTGTRADAARLFHGLSEGGTVSMPLQDMLWGAYFGSVSRRDW
jgi:PhnB protein